MTECDAVVIVFGPFRGWVGYVSRNNDEVENGEVEVLIFPYEGEPEVKAFPVT